MNSGGSGSGAVVEAGETQADFLFLRQLGQGVTLRLSEPLAIPPKESANNLLCVANQHGLLFAATSNGFIAHALSDVRATYTTASKNSSPKLEAWRSFASHDESALGGGRITFLRTAASEQILLAALDNGRVAGWKIDEIKSAASPPPPTFVLAPPAEGLRITELAPNPSDKPELCAVLFSQSSQAGSPKGSVALCNILIGQWQGEVAPPAPATATALCWSVKGKQLALGFDNGEVVQFTPEGQVKDRVGRPESLEGTPYVENVLWLENHVFVVTYNQPATGDEPEHQYEVFVVVREPKEGNNLTFVHFSDPAPPFGDTSRQGHRYMTWLKAWAPLKHMIFVANTSSTDVGLLGCTSVGSTSAAWQNMELEDTSRPALPFSSLDKGADTSPVGLSLDMTPDANVDDPQAAARGEDGKEALSPVPVLLIYTNDGVLLAYHVINVDAGAGRYSGLQAPTAISGGGEPSMSTDTPTAFTPSRPTQPQQQEQQKPISLGSPSPAFGQASAFGSAVSTPAFGKQAQIGTSNVSPFSAFAPPSSASTSSFSGGFGGFASKTEGSTGFGFGSASGLGSTNGSAFGASSKPSSPFAQASTSTASSAPAFGETSAPSAFGSTSTPSAFGSSTSAFGSSSTASTSAAPAFGSSTTSSGFGSPTTLGQPTRFGQIPSFGGGVASSGAPAQLTSAPNESQFPMSTAPVSEKQDAPLTPASSAFGAFASKPASTGFSFGTTPASSGSGSVFGAGGNLSSAPSGPVFGQPASSSPASKSAFAPSDTSKPSSSFSFGNPAPTPKTGFSFGPATPSGDTVSKKEAKEPTPEAKEETGALSFGGFSSLLGEAKAGDQDGGAQSTPEKGRMGNSFAASAAARARVTFQTEGNEMSREPNAAPDARDASPPPTSTSGASGMASPSADKSAPTFSFEDFKKSGKESESSVSTAQNAQSKPEEKSQVGDAPPSASSFRRPEAAHQVEQSESHAESREDETKKDVKGEGLLPTPRTPTYDEDTERSSGDELKTQAPKGAHNPFFEQSSGEGKRESEDNSRSDSTELDETEQDQRPERDEAISPSPLPPAIAKPSPQASSNPSTPSFSFAGAGNNPKNSSFLNFTNRAPRSSSPLSGAPLNLSDLSNSPKKAQATGSMSQSTSASKPPPFSFAPQPSSTSGSAKATPPFSFAPQPGSTSESVKPALASTDDRKAKPFSFGTSSSQEKADQSAAHAGAFVAKPGSKEKGVSFGATGGAQEQAPSSFGPAEDKNQHPPSDDQKPFSFSTAVSKPAAPAFSATPPMTEVLPAQADSRAQATHKPHGQALPGLQHPPKLGISKAQNSSQMQSGEGLSGLFLKLYLTMEEELETLKGNVKRCSDFQELLRSPSSRALSKGDLVEPASWTFGELDTVNMITQELIDSVESVDNQRQEAKLRLREIQGEQLKVEAKREEIARFLRARRDPAFRNMVKVRQLGPEHSENQAKLRKGYALLQKSVEELEKHILRLHETAVDEKVGRPVSMQAPSLDAIRRAVRSITRTAEAKMMELEELKLSLELIGGSRSSETRAQPVDVEGDASFASNASDVFGSIGALDSSLPAVLNDAPTTKAHRALQSRQRAESFKKTWLQARSEPLLNQRISQPRDDASKFDAADLNMAFARGTIHVSAAGRPQAVSAAAQSKDHQLPNLSSAPSAKSDSGSTDSSSSTIAPFTQPNTSSSPFGGFSLSASLPSSALPNNAFDLPPEASPFAPKTSNAAFGGGRIHHGSKGTGKRNAAVALPTSSPSAQSPLSSDFFAMPQERKSTSPAPATPPASLPFSAAATAAKSSPGHPEQSAFGSFNAPSKPAFSFAGGETASSSSSTNKPLDASDSKSAFSFAGGAGFGGGSTNTGSAFSRAMGGPSAFTTFKGLEDMKPISGSNQQQPGFTSTVTAMPDTESSEEGGGSGANEEGDSVDEDGAQYGDDDSTGDDDDDDDYDDEDDDGEEEEEEGEEGGEEGTNEEEDNDDEEEEGLSAVDEEEEGDGE